MRNWPASRRKEITSDFAPAGFDNPAGAEVIVLQVLSPDGQRVAAASEDNTARVWDVATGREVARMKHEHSVHAVAFSPDGRRLASGGEDKVVQVWLWQSKDMIAEACARLPRNLTQEEWRQYLGDEPYHPTCPNLPTPKP